MMPSNDAARQQLKVVAFFTCGSASRGEHMARSLLTVLTLAWCFLLASEVAHAAQCGSGFYLELTRRAKTLDRSAGNCLRVTKTRHPIPAMCKVCGPTVNQLIALESVARKNKACFSSAKDRKNLAKLSAVRADLLFIKRGCGF